MMVPRRASHKLARSYISATSTCKPRELLALCEEVATGIVGTGLHRGAKARITVTSRGQNALIFRIGYKTAAMNFRVDVSRASQRTYLISRITGFKVRQDTFLGFIPAGPRRLVGWKFYSDFMTNLEDAIYELDANAEVEIL